MRSTPGYAAPVAQTPGMGTRPRARDGSTQAERQIFAATERLLDSVTARDLSVAQILEEAKVSRGTFYHYFSSKWEVIIALATSVMEDIHGWIRLFSRGGDEPRDEALRKSIEEGVRIWAEHRAVLRAIVEHWREVPELRAMWLDLMERYIVEIAEEIDRDRAAGIAPTGPGQPHAHRRADVVDREHALYGRPRRGGLASQRGGRAREPRSTLARSDLRVAERIGGLHLPNPD